MFNPLAAAKMVRQASATSGADGQYNQNLLRHISGKWFIGDHEIPDCDIRRYFYEKGNLNSPEECDRTVRAFLDTFREDGKWRPLEILSQVDNTDTTGVTLPFPLTPQQLKIINNLIYGEALNFFLLTGVGGSGKSTFLNIVRQLFGGDCSYASLSDLSNKFTLASALEHRLICSDEISSDDINNGSIKLIASGQGLNVAKKFQDSHNVISQTRMLFACNNPPAINLADSGSLRRIVYYRMNNKIKNPNPKLNQVYLSFKQKVLILQMAKAIDMTDWKKDFEKDTREVLLSHNSVYLSKEYKDYTRYQLRCSNMGYKPFNMGNWFDIVGLIKEWGMDKDGTVKQ